MMTVKHADRQAKEKAWAEFMERNGSTHPLLFNDDLKRKKVFDSLKAIEGVKRILQEVLK